MMEILSHRGLGFGKPENTLEAFRAAQEADCGLETDIRIGLNGEVVISHEPPVFPELLQAEAAIPLFKTFSHPVAVHLKDEAPELGNQAGKLFEGIESVFLFDPTIETARKIRKTFPNIQIGFSVGEGHFLKTIYFLEEVLGLLEGDIIWWDEWTKLGAVYNEEQIKAIRLAGKKVYAISPELHRATEPRHELAANPEKSWEKLVSLAVDGICTDFPLELKEFLRRE